MKVIKSGCGINPEINDCYNNRYTDNNTIKWIVKEIPEYYSHKNENPAVKIINTFGMYKDEEVSIINRED